MSRTGARNDVDGAILELLSSALLELLNPPRLIERAVLARVKRMRGAGDFYYHFWVLGALHGSGLGGAYSRADKELCSRGNILKEYGPVVGWMDVLFHCFRTIAKPGFPGKSPFRKAWPYGRVITNRRGYRYRSGIELLCP